MTTSNKPGAGKNSEVIQRQNRQLVLRLVKEKQVTSRIELASLSGLKQATITNIVNDLLGMGYLEETGLIESANGRRVVGLQLNLEKMRVLVVRITASYYAAGIYDVYGECLSVKKEFIDTYQDFEETSRSIIACLKKCMRGCSGKHFLGLGIVFHGGNPAFRDEYLKPQGEPEKSTRLHELFYNVFKMPVFVHKFGDMVAYYAWERKEREQEKVHTLVCLSVGYAVDCAVVSYGRVLPNRLDGYGEYGHVSIDYGGKPCQCGNRGCIHGFVSVEAVMGMVKEKSAEYPQSCLTDPENIREVIKAYYDRDPLALAIYEKVA
ncbi:MAG TPA: hypothetical protein DEQ02_08630, partial [Ruminococcaceae bacterium]|nr:hypothetical protein [Oscillospiraceae bacterium]